MAEQQREAERTDAEQNGDGGVAEHARELRREFSPSRLGATLEDAVKERPLLDHLLDFGIVARAVAIGVVGALILWILVGPASAAVALVVLFGGSWYLLAQRSYNTRRQTVPFDSEDRETRRDDDDADSGDGDADGSEG